ncbi:MAG: ATP-dependent 6-phosphofructokinase [Kordiimonadaceae bacterium]|jgi:ATP-dependent phosphofructokinase / diphosphate-dependent phosphofructokinase|nr:ATP-dependent 6-phosphofructokinase [Kordiimonadaceae bacterium]MBT6036205.1 ATP-dependent 6-phosphofructokinase [Kordiimonadaceae bacterium]MBT7582254.1 ATP-dependent 6-phosphofructokinase [Kordiimonadaceae bacterium]
MKIGILTSGGDVPGLNACIKAIVAGAEKNGWSSVGIKRGWKGLFDYDPDGDVEKNAALSVPLNASEMRGLENVGGTFLHTSRFNPVQIDEEFLPDFLKGKVPPSTFKQGTFDCTDHVLRVLDYMEIDVLIPIGGDGSLRFAAHLSAKDFPIISIPKTMDNDVNGTDYCIGFSTCVTRCVDSINKIRTTAASHERIAIIELFGRHSGEPTLLAGHIASADRVLIPEVPVDLDHFSDLIISDREKNPNNYAIAVVAEGVTVKDGENIYQGKKDHYGNDKLGGIGDVIYNDLRANHHVSVLTQPLAYLLRSGEPDALDKLAATSFGTMAIQMIEQKNYGKMTAIVDGNYAVTNNNCVLSEQTTPLVSNLYDAKNYRPEIKNILGRPMYL